MQGHHGGAGGRVGHRAGTAQAQGQGRRMRRKTVDIIWCKG